MQVCITVGVVCTHDVHLHKEHVGIDVHVGDAIGVALVEDGKQQGCLGEVCEWNMLPCRLTTPTLTTKLGAIYCCVSSQ